MQAGTKVKQIFNKLVASETSAKKLFNSAMETSQTLNEQGDILQFGDISSMAKTDLPKAISLVSKLYVEGKLTSDVMQKMFTARHFREASELFRQINGDVETFKNKITSGVSYLADYEKKMFDVNEQVKTFKNNLADLSKNGLQVATKGVSGLLMAFNEYSQYDLVNSLLRGITNVGALGIAFTGLQATILLVSASLTKLKGILGLSKEATRLKTLFSFVTLNPLITLTVGALVLLGKTFYDIKKGAVDFKKSIEDLKVSQEMLTNSSTSLAKKLLTTDNLFNKLSSENVADMFIDVTNSAKGMTSALDKATPSLSTLMSALNELQEIEMKPLPEATIGLKDSIKSQIEDANTLIAQLNPENLKSKIQDTFNEVTYSDVSSSFDFMGPEEVQGKISSLQDNLDTYLEVSKKYAVGTKEFNDALKNQNISERDMYQLSKYIDTAGIGELVTSYKERSEAIEEEKAKLDRLEKEYLKYKEAIDKVNTSLQTTLDKNRLIMLQEYGTVTLDVDGTDKIFSGIDAYEALYKEKFKDNLNYLSSEYASQLDELNKKSNLTSEELIRKNTLEGLQSKIKEGLGDDIFEGMGDIVDISSSKLLSYASEILSYTERIHEEQVKGTEESAKIVKNLEKNRDLSIQLYNLALKSKREESQTNYYKMKYTQIGKSDLSLNLELAKIGKTAVEQERLKYQYKLDGYNLDKQFAMMGVEANKLQLQSIISSANFIPLKGVDASELAGVNSSNKANELGKKLMDNNSLEDTKGDAGKELSTVLDLLGEIAQAYLKVENYSRSAMIDPLVKFNTTLEGTQELLQKTLGLESNLFNVDNDTKKLQLMKENIEKTKNQITKEYSGKNSSLPSLLGDLDYSQLQSFSGDLNTEINERYLDLQLQGSEATKEDRDVYIELVELRTKLNVLLTEEYETQKASYELDVKRADAWSKMGSTISKLGDATGMESLGNLGNSFNEYSSFFKQISNPDESFSFSKILDFEGFASQSEEWVSNFSSMLDSAMSGMSMGSSIGSLLFSNSSSAVSSSAAAGGSLGGTIAGAGGGSALASMLGMGAAAAGPAGLAIAVGGSLLGSALAGEDKTDEAAAYNEEQKEIYDANTEALQELSVRMSSLLSGVSSLDNTLLSSLSEIPTLLNIDNISTAMADMKDTLTSTRDFESTAYQVTHKESGSSGFLGMGSTPDTYWTETVEMDVQSLLKKYGYYKDIKEMSTDQMRDFSEWLDDYDLGDSDNFSELSDSIENYAQAVDTMNDDLSTLFYDSTMEGFSGISSLEKEQLREQLEDFYTNLDIQIDDAVSAQIDTILEEMSSMVTVTEDVRSSFVDAWADSGTSAGEVFLSSMSVYLEAMSNNVSQIFYDVFYSDINNQLDKQFQDFSESLVELKKQGEDLEWTSVTDALKESFEGVVTTIVNANQESETLSTTIRELQNIALDSGLSLGDLISVGLATSTQESLVDTFQDTLLNTELDSGLTSIGDAMGDTIGDALTDKVLDSLYDSTIMELGDQLDSVISGSMDFSSIVGLVNDALEVGVSVETQRRKIEALTSAFDFSQEITYENQDDTISYETGTSSNINNYYYLTSKVDAGNVIESDSIESLVESTMDILIEKFKEEKGIDLLSKSY